MNYNHLNQYQKQISWNMMPKAKEIFQLYTELLKHYDWFLFVTQHFIMRICCWKLEKLVGYFSDRGIQFCTDINVNTLMTSCFQVRNKDPEDPHTELTLEWIVVANCCSSCKWKYKPDFFFYFFWKVISYCKLLQFLLCWWYNSDIILLVSKKCAEIP